MVKSTAIVPIEHIEQRIFLLRGKKVMLDFHLAEIYRVQTKILNKAVARNHHRFPEDFLFQLTPDEWNSLRFQIGTSSWGGQRNFGTMECTKRITHEGESINQLMQSKDTLA